MIFQQLVRVSTNAHENEDENHKIYFIYILYYIFFLVKQKGIWNKQMHHDL